MEDQVINSDNNIATFPKARNSARTDMYKIHVDPNRLFDQAMTTKRPDFDDRYEVLLPSRSIFGV